MTNIKIIEEKPLTMGKLKKELENIKKRDKELSFRAARTEEYLQSMPVEDKADDIYKKVEKLDIPRLKDIHIVKIIDTMPKTAEEVKAILQAYTITVSNDNIKKILDALQEFRKE
jgi:DNA-directed RNA polymerase subunit F